AHGDGALWHLLCTGEKMAIVFNRFSTERFQTGTGSQAGSGLVKADVAVASNAKNLQVDTASGLYGSFVARAILVVITGDCAVGNMDVIARDIHMRKKIVRHEVVKTLRMRRRKAKVFVEIERLYPRKIKISVIVKCD